MNVGVLLLTHNEELHIGACLQSLEKAGAGLVDKIVVVDSGSRDRTLDIVRAHSRPVEIIERPFVSFSDQRNHGLDHAFAPGSWVLHLDADERLTLALAREIAALPADGKPVAYNLPSMTFFRGHPIPRASGYPVYQTRLSKVGPFRFVEVGHGQKAPPGIGPIPRTRNPYEHHPFDKGLGDWIARHDRYSTREAEEWLRQAKRYTFSAALRDPIARRQWLKQLSRSLPMAPSLVYYYLLLLKGGWRDGPEGRDYCRMRFVYENLVILKYHELKRKAGQ